MGNKKVPKNLTELLTMDISLIGDPFLMQTRRNVFLKGISTDENWEVILKISKIISRKYRSKIPSSKGIPRN